MMSPSGRAGAVVDVDPDGRHGRRATGESSRERTAVMSRHAMTLSVGGSASECQGVSFPSSR